MAETETYYEDLAVGTVHECGSHVVTEQEIVEYAERYDPQRIHTDPEYAAESIHSGLIASGWHVLSICTKLVMTELTGETGSQGAAGIDAIDLERPVRPGDSVVAQARIADKRTMESREDVGLVHVEMTLQNETGDRIVQYTPRVVFSRDEDRR